MRKRSRAAKPATSETTPLAPSHTHGEEACAIAGEVLGAVIGASAGPPGVVAGMVIGAAAGALAGKVLDQEAERAHQRDEALDDEIGVTRGSLGAPPPEKPKNG